jgi:outer membrane protein assembly factor BamA
MVDCKYKALNHRGNFFKNIFFILFVAMATFLMHSCKIGTVVKKYPEGPFIFRTTLKVTDKGISKSEKNRLEDGLRSQLDDSLQSREVDKVFYATIKNPPRLDSAAIGKSLQFMHYYLNAQGYFADSMGFTTRIKPMRDQERTFVDFDIHPGPITRIDSLSYTLRDSNLQEITNADMKDVLIRKGDPFAQAPISSEMDRLVELYHNNGYQQFSRSQLFALWDTLDLSMLQLTLDPLEQAEQLERLRQRRHNPTANLNIRLRPVTDSGTIRQYYVGKVLVYPDVHADSTGRKRLETTMGNVTVVQHFKKFKPKIFPPVIYLKEGEMYRQSRYLRTLNRLNNMGSWRLVDIQQVPREQQDTVDFIARLSPARLYSFTTNLEGSFSQSVISGNFVGLGVNVGLQNRNFLKGANLLSTNLRYGVELGQLSAGQFIQTQQVSLSNSVMYPRFIFPGASGFKENFRGNTTSILTLNGANTERRTLFNLTSLNSSWGYEFTWRGPDYSSTNRSFTLGIKIPNIEYSYLVRRQGLLDMIEKNPAVANIFSDGLIASNIINFTMPWTKKNSRTTQVLRSNLEYSGLLAGLIRNKFLDEQLYRFVKLDLEYARMIKWTRTSLVMRGFGGLGYEFESTRNPEKRDKLPFFKQYYSGGPNSMRAWQLRRLGPGSTVKAFTGELSVPDRFGDVQLEGNIEYRMPLMRLAGIPINGAIFTDVGNVWYLKEQAGRHDEVFNISRLGTDLAIGSGAGARIDFGFFVIRLDWGYKVKDPSPNPQNMSYQNKFFAYPFFKGSQVQLGIGYPFIF